MLARITGKVEEKSPGKVILSLGKVSFEVLVPLSLFETLPPPGGECTLYVSCRLRGESLELYGFEDWESRELFTRLQAISRVGPRLALNILSVFAPHELEEAVAQDDYRRLAKVPGIGMRRAERLCVELRSRLGIKEKPGQRPPLFKEAMSALTNLGFSRQEAERALEQVFSGEKDLSTLIREALKTLSEA